MAKKTTAQKIREAEKRKKQNAILDKVTFNGMDFPKTLKNRVRDFGEARFKETVELFKKTGAVPTLTPSEAKKKKGKPKAPGPGPGPKGPGPKGPGPKGPGPGPTPKGMPGCKVIVFWRDESEHVSGKEFKHQKQIYKRMSIDEVYIDIFGWKEIGTQGYLQEPYGEIGETKTEIYCSEEQRKALMQKYRGWTVIYDATGQDYKTLLSILGMISHGVYNQSKKEKMIQNFMLKVERVHPENGKRLIEDYEKFKNGGFQ